MSLAALLNYAEHPGGADALEVGGPMSDPRQPRSFELAFSGLYRLAFKVAFRILGDRGDAEDVAQEAMARALLRWTALHEHPEGWVSKVASNLAIDRHRRRRRLAELPAGPVRVLDDHFAERGDLVRALRHLPRRQREVVVLRYLADFSEAETAAALGCAPGTVKAHASRGLSALRRQLGNMSGTGGDDVRAS